MSVLSWDCYKIISGCQIIMHNSAPSYLQKEWSFGRSLSVYVYIIYLSVYLISFSHHQGSHGQRHPSTTHSSSRPALRNYKSSWFPFYLITQLSSQVIWKTLSFPSLIPSSFSPFSSCRDRTAIRGNTEPGTSGAVGIHHTGTGAASGDRPASSTAGSAAPPSPVRFAGRQRIRTAGWRQSVRRPRQPKPRCTTSRMKFGYCRAIAARETNKNCINKELKMQ